MSPTDCCPRTRFLQAEVVNKGPFLQILTGDARGPLPVAGKAALPSSNELSRLEQHAQPQPFRRRRPAHKRADEHESTGAIMQRQASGRQVIDKGIQYLATSEWQTTRQKWISVVSQCGARLARASDPPLVRGGVMPAAADHTVIVRKEPDLLDVRRVPTMPVALPGTPSSVMDW